MSISYVEIATLFKSIRTGYVDLIHNILVL